MRGSRVTQWPMGGRDISVIDSSLPQVVWSHKPFIAHRANKILLPSVGSDVPGQLVTPGELLEAARPGTRERSLSWNKENYFSTKYKYMQN